MDDYVTVRFYDENGNRTKWNENINFEKYKALMNRSGYTFVGWFTRMDCSCLGTCSHIIKESDFITYDKFQANQTLYARWEKNKIIFDMNGATSEQIEDVVFDSKNPIISLTTPILSYNIDYYVTRYEGVYDTLTIYKEFVGWYIEGTNTKITELDLSRPNIGNVKVVARWSEYKWNKPIEKRSGYGNVDTWYYKNQYADEFIISKIDDTSMQHIVNNGLNLYGKENLIFYTITYENLQGAVNNNNSKYNVNDEITLLSLPDRVGYIFNGWFNSYGNKITGIVKGTIGDITLIAKWKAKEYTITVQGIDVNPSSLNDFNGNPKYNTKDFGVLYYTYGDDTHDQGFYVDAALANKLPTNYFTDFCVNAQGKTNFVFSGLFHSSITDNGHTYASYVSDSCVLSASFTIESEPKLSEESKSGTLYVLLVPKQYTITLNANVSSQPDNSLKNSNTYTKSVLSYYNELPESIAVMPQGNYYIPVAYGLVIDYFDSTGCAQHFYDFSGNSTMNCRWEPIKYQVQFELNGGSCSVSSMDIPYGSAYGTLPVPTRAGCIFDGWYTQDGVIVNCDTQMFKPERHTLYAHWRFVAFDSIIRTGECKINGSGHYTEDSFTITDINQLKEQGFSKLTITINCDIRQQNVCYQYYYVTNGEKQIYADSTLHEGDWNTYTFHFTIDLASISSNTFKFKCQAENKLFKDFWIGTVSVNIQAIY